MPDSRGWRRRDPEGIRRVRRARATVLGLLLGSIVLALLLAYRYRLGIPQASESLVVGGGTLAGIYLAWTTYRDSQASGKMLSLGAIADELALAVRDQWEREARIRRLNDPYPLPVRWLPADYSSPEEWEALINLATSGAGWPIPVGTWAADPSELAGSDNQLVDVLERVPTGRLAVLGKPGSGKTILMVRMLLDLMQRRPKGDVVPVLLPAASWNPTLQNFHAWIISQLLVSHPALATPYLDGERSTSRIEALLEEQLIMPILDGFDELPEGVRNRAISEINAQLRPGERLVITSRTAEYRTATRPAVGPEITLSAASVEVRPLSRQDVVNYLRQTAGGPRNAARWDPVFTELSRSKALARVLSSPLMISLARAIYNPRPGEQAVSLPDPVELCALRGKRAIEHHLLDEFIPAAFRPGFHKDSIGREWGTHSAEKWLAFLANHLERIIGEPDISWWHLNIASPALTSTAAGLIAGLTVGLPILLIPVLLVSISIIRVKVAASPVYDPGFFGLLGGVFQQYWTRIIEIVLIFGAASGVISLAAAIGPHGSHLDKSISTPWNGRYSIVSKIGLGLLFGVIYAFLIYAIFQPDSGWSEYFDIFLAAFVGIYAGRACLGESFRANTVAAISVGAIVSAPFFLYKDISRPDSVPIGLSSFLLTGLVSGLAAALVIATRGENEQYPSRSIRWSLRTSFGKGITAGAAVAILAEIFTHQIRVTLAFGIIVGLAAVTITGLERVPGDLRLATSPTLVLKRDRSATLLLCLITSVVVGLIVGIGTLAASIDWLFPDISPTWDAIIFGITIGPAVGFTFGFTLRGYGSAWAQWVFTRQVLAMRRKTPQRFMAFLEDSHARGVLRQVGPVYQFRHIELQRRLASRITEDSAPKWLQQVAISETVQGRQSVTRLRPFTPLIERFSQRRRFVIRIICIVATLVAMTLTVTFLDHGAFIKATSQRSSTLIPVVKCPSSYGIGGTRQMPSPVTESAPIPSNLAQMFTYYIDKAAFIPPILGPRGWACSASVGADGGWTVQLRPRDISAKDQIIQADGPSCLGCTFYAVCQIVPHVSAEMNYNEKCPANRIPRQIVSWIVGSPKYSSSGNDVIGIVDPPGVKGYVAHSGGQYISRGILLYFWGQPASYFGFPGGEGASAAMTISCVLPSSDIHICKAIFASFRQLTGR